MKNISMYGTNFPRLMALFQKRIEGDDALLHLANLRFKEAGMGIEFYADTLNEMDKLLRFKPFSDAPAVAHLQRGINLLEEKSQRLIMDFASSFAGQIYGLVIHDQDETVTHFDDYLSAVCRIESKLKGLKESPYLFIEYAVGLKPDRFLELFKRIHNLEHVSACVDIGHIGICQVRDAFSRSHPKEDVCTFTPYDPRLKQVIDDVEGSVHSALPVVVNLIHALGRLGKPLHFHLHDGHPLSTLSPFGISDHISFLSEIPIPFEYKGKQSLHTMFGPSGLSEVVTESLKALSPDLISFTLEIHPVEGRVPFDDTSYLFDHWKDKANAERMNYWLLTLQQNHILLLDICRKCIVNLSVKQDFPIAPSRIKY
jgi:hypothetical protein